MKMLVLLLTLVCLISLSIKSVVALEFSTNIDLTYEVSENGETTVTQRIRLINLSSLLYPEEYKVVLNTSEPSEIEGWDGLGQLKTKIQKETEKTIVDVVFNEKVVGKGKVLDWTLRYQSKEIAKKIGRIWEVNLPRINNKDEVSSYNIKLIVPRAFGSPAYVWPPPKYPFFWTKKDKSTDGVSLAFGDWQGFKLSLTYHLDNSSLLPKDTFITLPSDSAFQKILLEKIEPSPRSIKIDRDGNWLASFLLLPLQKKEVKVIGYAQTFINPIKDFPKEKEETIYSSYLNPLPYWEQDEEIKKIAARLKTVEAIYDYVVDTLDYDYRRAETKAERRGAKKALIEPKGSICMEFTDLFIALARAAGLPAREVDGFAYTDNPRIKPLSLVTDVLHSWPEYWDRDAQLWRPIDPTWGKTSQSNYFHRFDFNHLAFVKRGLDSNSPWPVGSYKGKQASKDVEVEFSSQLPSTLYFPVKTTVSDSQGLEREKLIVPLLFLLILPISFFVIYHRFFNQLKKLT